MTAVMSLDIFELLLSAVAGSWHRCLASTSLEFGTALLTSVTTAILILVVEIGLFEPNILFHNLRRPLLKAELSSSYGGPPPPGGHLRKMKSDILKTKLGNLLIRWIYFCTKSQSSSDKPIIAVPLKSDLCFVPFGFFKNCPWQNFHQIEIYIVTYVSISSYLFFFTKTHFFDWECVCVNVLKSIFDYMYEYNFGCKHVCG